MSLHLSKCHIVGNHMSRLICVFANMVSTPMTTIVPSKSDSDVMICLQSYEGLRIDRSLVY